MLLAEGTLSLFLMVTLGDITKRYKFIKLSPYTVDYTIFIDYFIVSELGSESQIK